MTDNWWQQPTESVCAHVATVTPKEPVSTAEAGAAALTEGVIIHISTGEIVWCNPAACPDQQQSKPAVAAAPPATGLRRVSRAVSYR